MRFVDAVVGVAGFVVVADAKSCNATLQETIVSSSSADTCEDDSGYSVTSLKDPSDAELAIMCTSSACQTIMEQLEELGPSECTMGFFPLFSGLIYPYEEYCSANTSSGSSATGSSDSASDSSSATGTSQQVAISIDTMSHFASASTSTSASSDSSTSGSSSTSALSTTATTVISASNSTSSAEADSSVTPQSSSTSGSDGSTGASSGLESGAIVGIVVGVLVLVALILAALFIARRRRKNRESIDEPSSDLLGFPASGKKVRLLEDDYASAELELQDTRGSSKTYSTEGSMPHSKRGKCSLWEDPMIVAARISIDRIQLGPLIGRGGFGEVHRGLYRHQDVAVKMLLPEKRKDLEQIQTFLAEIRLIATMEHPFILNFIGVAWESLSDLYCVTEFMAGGDLRSLLNAYQANEAPQGMDASKVEIAYQVAYALTYLHSLEPVVLHRDLKSRNILLTESFDAKITDFGTSRVRSTETMTAGVGSWMWMAPEVMVGDHYDEKADVFSLGVVLSELDTHEMPYSQAKGKGLPDAAVMQRILAGKLQVQFSRFTDPDMTQFAESCVSLDPRDRPTAAEALYFFQKARTRF